MKFFGTKTNRAFRFPVRPVSLGTPVEMREFWRVWDLMPGGHMHT